MSTLPKSLTLLCLFCFLFSILSSQNPGVWFQPLPDISGSQGSLDYLDLFNSDAEWADSRGNLDVFMLYGEWLADFPWTNHASDEELKKVIEFSENFGIPLGFEAGPLVPTDTCGQGIEGFFGPEEGLRIVRRIKQLGGELTRIVMDEPVGFGHIYNGDMSCNWPLETVALQAGEYFDSLRTIFPEIIVGGNEPIWNGVDIDVYKLFLDVFKDINGYHLDFFHVDIDFNRHDWPSAILELEDFCKQRDIKFGVIYIGDNGLSSDEAWVQQVEDRFITYEVVNNGKPDRVNFASWVDRPQYVLPEIGESTFTYLLNRYMRNRTEMLFDYQLAGNHLDYSGQLQQLNGTSTIANADIEISITALEGPGLVYEYNIKGTVPMTAKYGNLGFRINTECECPDPAQVFLYEAGYFENGSSENKLYNYNLGNSSDGWDHWGNGKVDLVTSDLDDTKLLVATTSPGQHIGLNSPGFDVTPGTEYTATFLSRVAPFTGNSGYFAIFLLDETGEGRRDLITLKTAELPIDTIQTDDLGKFSSTFDIEYDDAVEVNAWYNGNNVNWPSKGAMDVVSGGLFDARYAQLKLNIFPNPIRDQLTMEFELPKSAFSELDIYNELGQHIAKEYIGHIAAGKQSLQINPGLLPEQAGVYIFRLRIGKEIGVAKIIKIN